MIQNSMYHFINIFALLSFEPYIFFLKEEKKRERGVDKMIHTVLFHHFNLQHISRAFLHVYFWFFNNVNFLIYKKITLHNTVTLSPYFFHRTQVIILNSTSARKLLKSIKITLEHWNTKMVTNGSVFFFLKVS